MKFSIIIPCYNEGKNVRALLKSMLPLTDCYDLECIFVENGSSDGSREIFANEIDGLYPGVRAVYVPQNKGYGYGIQQGLKAAKGEYTGWIHADMQIMPQELEKFFAYIMKHNGKKLFLKGRRVNRSRSELFFTTGQSICSSVLFRTRLTDIGAVPVLFHRVLLDDLEIEDMPDDFSIELYVYLQAKKAGFIEKRTSVEVLQRRKGSSSWNHGIWSKIRQGRVVFEDSLKIKRGIKVT